MANDSDLREFADGPGRKSQTSDNDGPDDNEDEVAGGNPGVLGMLYQFSKAQADKGAGAVM
jgi:autophagy-related protein 9